ncbi:hypothetical protein PL321_09330 [Caloramator sp. mosi_1]|uniref:hypothetical protein n=1 Tax=Caloramator sp. mosi_1 TaxID=3023090 RepID=UPI0023617931|nr:hypothetical protein [Caloramator sp. mosi_1]WDC85477.1 hypothetical protein PL321_09330 [Caloramator sp. mosi_1]
MINFNNEEIGISAEIAIADIFDIKIPDYYRERGRQEVIDVIKPAVITVFEKHQLPKPQKHIAEDQNPIDFILDNNLTLSVKTNQKSLGKVAPQRIGQPTSKTYFEYFKDIIDEDVPDSYENRIELFKKITIEKIDLVMKEYWNNIFECDYYLHFFNIIDKIGNINSNPSYIVLNKPNKSPDWKKMRLPLLKH